MARRKREEKLKNAERYVKNNAYSIKKGIDEYTKEDEIRWITKRYRKPSARIFTISIRSRRCSTSS